MQEHQNSVFDGVLVPVPCDECGKEFEEPIGRLKTSPDLSCHHCGHTISVDGTKTREGLERFEEWRKNPSRPRP
jgi:DNA-directed RNA polymerase subunit RPC12/RpoP